MAASLVGLKHSGDVCYKDGKATPSSPIKCLGVHFCYSVARLQMSGCALLLLRSQTSNVQACIAVTPQPDFKCLGVHCCYSAARLQMSMHALLLLHSQTSNVWACIALTPWLLLCSQTSNVQACIAVTLQPDFKCLGMHCSYSTARLQMSRCALLLLHGCYSMARLQMSGYALLLLCSQTHWSPGRYSIHFHGGKLNLTKIDLTFVKALMS